MKVLLLASILISGKVFAWGQTGHRVVGEIAQKLLTTKALTRTHELLQGQSLARASTWPDEIKSEPETYKHTFRWHYTDWPDEMQEHNEENAAGILVKSIKEHLSVLKDPEAANDKKTFALKFLIHLIGDLHMPLHVGNGLDQGGNSCKVLFHGKPTNLHSLWDEGMIDFTNLSYTELSEFISQGKKIEEIREWRKGDIIDWARESKILRAEVYPPNVITPAEQISVRQFCRRDIVVPQEELPKLAYEYSYKSMPVVEKRLFQAGIRLAMLLNQNLN